MPRRFAAKLPCPKWGGSTDPYPKLANLTALDLASALVRALISRCRRAGDHPRRRFGRGFAEHPSVVAREMAAVPEAMRKRNRLHQRGVPLLL